MTLGLIYSTDQGQPLASQISAILGRHIWAPNWHAKFEGQIGVKEFRL